MEVIGIMEDGYYNLVFWVEGLKLYELSATGEPES